MFTEKSTPQEIRSFYTLYSAGRATTLIQLLFEPKHLVIVERFIFWPWHRNHTERVTYRSLNRITSRPPGEIVIPTLLPYNLAVPRARALTDAFAERGVTVEVQHMRWRAIYGWICMIFYWVPLLVIYLVLGIVLTVVTLALLGRI